jgi:hypothetical protein
MSFNKVKKEQINGVTILKILKSVNKNKGLKNLRKKNSKGEELMRKNEEFNKK